MPNIYQRGNQFYVDVRVGGTRVRKAAGSSRLDALRLLNELTNTTAASSMPVILDAYLQRQVIYSKAKSVKNARHSSTRLLEYFGDADAAKLTLQDIDGFVAWRKTNHGVRNKTINGDLIIFRAALNYAVSTGLLDPFNFKIRLLKAPRKKVVPLLTHQDIEKLLCHAEDPWYGVILIAAATAFRADEILHLQWRDIHFGTTQVSVTAKEGWEPKSYQERSCYASDRVMNYLRSRRKTVRSKWVFPNGSDKPMDIFRVTKRVRSVFEKAGLYLKGCNTLHRIRHSACSTWLGQSVDIETCRVLMGHADASTTMLYSHSTDRRIREAATKALV